MTSCSEIVEERGDYRVLLVADPFPEEPYNDGQSPVIRFEGGSADHIRAAGGDEERVERAAEFWGPPNRSSWDKFEKYMRGFFGTTEIITYYSGSYWYVTYDTAAWRERIGASGPDLTEWIAYCEGEVYGYEVEKLTHLYVKNKESSDYSEHSEAWENVDSSGGFYGYDWAFESARRALDDVIESGGK